MYSAVDTCTFVYTIRTICYCTLIEVSFILQRTVRPGVELWAVVYLWNNGVITKHDNIWKFYNERYHEPQSTVRTNRTSFLLLTAIDSIRATCNLFAAYDNSDFVHHLSKETATAEEGSKNIDRHYQGGVSNSFLHKIISCCLKYLLSSSSISTKFK